MADTKTNRVLEPAGRTTWRVEEFCGAYGIGRTLFYEEVRRGELSVLKIGKRTVVSAEEAAAWQRRKSRQTR